ncbi:MAG: uroporphyrinogen-III synthase [Flavobacteriales bacterium]
MKRIFISRDLTSDDALVSQLVSNGMEVHAQSLIALEAIPFSLPIPTTDWIFFSSQHAVQFFFQQNVRLENQKLAAIGKATAAVLGKYGACSFAGASMDTVQVATAFAKVCGGESILFPQAEYSLKTIQKLLQPTQCVDLICYKSRERPAKIAFCDWLVFTSPGNVRAYAMANHFTNQQFCYALGKATAEALHQAGGQSVELIESLSAGAIMHAINGSKGS